MLLSCGSAQLYKKGEDTLYVDASDPDSSLFAVFDGHGGPQAAVLCRNLLCPSILASARPISSESVEKAFWSADETLSEQGQFAGTTATVLCVDRTAGGGFSCLLSWVGDSTAIVIDMLAPHVTNSIVRSASTTDHTASNASESRRLRVEALVRDSLELLMDDPLAPPSVAQVEAAWAAALPGEPPLSADEAGLLTRELARGARLESLEADRIAAHVAKSLQAPAASADAAATGRTAPAAVEAMKTGGGGGVDLGTVASECCTMTNLTGLCSAATIEDDNDGGGNAAATVFNNDNDNVIDDNVIDTERGGVACAAVQPASPRRTRSPSKLECRKSSNGKQGSKPALTTYHRFNEQAPAQRGASLMMTRSIGDWDAARALTPHPQSLRFAVRGAGAADGDGEGAAAPPQRWAVVLASDGLWDHVPHDRCAAVVRAAVDPQGAADALVKLAKVGRTTPKDDTSVIVVDLNPAELPPRNPRCGGSGSCAVA